MDLDEKIEKEREKNDLLALEIERLKRRPYEVAESSDLRGLLPRERLQLEMTTLARRIGMKLSLTGELEELKRQKKESDQRLAELKLKKQESLRSDVNLTQTTSVSASVPSKKADYVRGRGAQSIASEAPWGSHPDVLKRRAIVKQNPTSNARGICELFDGANVPLTKRMKEAGSWSKAYKAAPYRHAVEALISRDRKIVSAWTHVLTLSSRTPKA